MTSIFSMKTSFSSFILLFRNVLVSISILQALNSSMDKYIWEMQIMQNWQIGHWCVWGGSGRTFILFV